jgi:hypothetical protein
MKGDTMDMDRLAERRDLDSLAPQGYVPSFPSTVPVAMTADVAVAGAGVAGVFAALAAARAGARTVLIDRFGQIGGNIGPGMILGGSIDCCVKLTYPNGVLAGLPLEIMQEHRAIFGDPLYPNQGDYRDPRAKDYTERFPERAYAFSYLLSRKLREAGVDMMLSAYVGDPILEDGRVTGLFAETVSGRLAVRARVVVDDTGNASLAHRAGCSILRRVPAAEENAPLIGEYRTGCNDPRHDFYNETGLMVVMAGIDWPRFREFNSSRHEPTADDKTWLKSHPPGVSFPSWTPLARKAFERDGFELVREILPKVILISRPRKMGYLGGSVGFMRYNITGQFLSDDWRHVSAIEAGAREHAWEFAQFLRRYVPGCEDVRLLFVSPFLGARGGPCILGREVLTVTDAVTGRRRPDVVMAVGGSAVIGQLAGGYDVPYGMLVPREVDGLLVTGRGASYVRRGHDPGVFRARELMLTLGQVTGEAAALCVRTGSTPQTLDVKALQRTLLERGICLGDAERLSALGLSLTVPPSGGGD